MLQDEPPCVEQGWVAVAEMGCDVGDPDVLLARAQLALQRARQFGDVNLETKALADGGLAHVQAGRVAEGMTMLDEAMALACGPADDPDTAGKSACSFFTACYYSADFDRASSWSDLMRARGLISSAAGAPVFLSNHCDGRTTDRPHRALRRTHQRIPARRLTSTPQPRRLRRARNSESR